MAANNPQGVPKLPKGRPVDLTTLPGASVLSATQQFVQFGITQPEDYNLQRLNIQCTGTITTGTAVLEASIDGGATWFIIPVTTTFAIIGTITGDTAASFAATYDVSALGAGSLFHFGFTAGTISGVHVWVLIA